MNCRVFFRVAGRLLFFSFVVIMLSGSVLQPLHGATGNGNPQLPWVRHQGDAHAQGVIVFVHGVLGNARTSWTNSNSYWPEMLTNDKTFDGQDIYVYDYPSPALGTSFSIDQLADDLRFYLRDDGVLRYKKITFLSHSMGGLVTRAFVVKYQKDVAPKIRFLYFFATPTTGNQLAATMSLLNNNPQFAQMKSMNNPDSYLATLQSGWMAARFGFRSYCAYEVQPFHGQIIVPLDSASHLCTEAPEPIDADHISIVKPVDLSGKSYRVFRSAFDETTDVPKANGSSLSKSNTIPLKLSAGAAQPPAETDPRLALAKKANELADETESIGQDLVANVAKLNNDQTADYSSEKSRNPDGFAEFKEHRDRFWDMRRDRVHDEAESRYKSSYMQPALDVREKLRIEVPGISSPDEESFYQYPTNPLGYEQIAGDLRALASACEIKSKANPAPITSEATQAQPTGPIASPPPTTEARPTLKNVLIYSAGPGVLDCDPRFTIEGGSISTTSTEHPAVEINPPECWMDPEDRQEREAYSDLKRSIAAHAGSKDAVKNDFDQFRTQLTQLRSTLKRSKDYQDRLDGPLSDMEQRFLDVADDKQKTLELLNRY
jgi:pimeloyl-ACP methyl ester carboxylesterase